MLPGSTSFCRWIAWNAAAQARATFSVSRTFCTDCVIVGVEMRNFGFAAPDGTHGTADRQRAGEPVADRPLDPQLDARAEVPLDDGVDPAVHLALGVGRADPGVDPLVEDRTFDDLDLSGVGERRPPRLHDLGVDVAEYYLELRIRCVDRHGLLRLDEGRLQREHEDTGAVSAEKMSEVGVNLRAPSGPVRPQPQIREPR
ncbi:hypothetical protein GCM10027610_089620 [Dactylosporangium cerinum]